MDKEVKEACSHKREQRKKKYDDYISDKTSKSAAAAVINRRPPYHLTYIRLAKEGYLPRQGENKENHREMEKRRA